MQPTWTAALAISLVLLSPVAAKTPPKKIALKPAIDAAISASPPLSSAFVGISVVSLRDGTPLCERNASNLFAPASNTKLFTTALALDTLGPQYRLVTTVVGQQPDPDGHIAGDLIFVGGGDPSLSLRRYPYDKRSTDADRQPFETIPGIEALADQIVAKGLTSIGGDVVGDDRRYLWEPYPDGWLIDDAIWEYGAPVSALIVNDNSFSLFIRPGDTPGALARVLTAPTVNPFIIENQVMTTAAQGRRISIARRIGSSELRVSGDTLVSGKGTSILLAVSDPAVFAAALLRDALIRRGVAVRGGAAARHLFPFEVPDRRRANVLPHVEGVEWARRESPPLVELLQVIDKVSQNLHAEAMLREVAAVRRNIGSIEAGQQEMRQFLTRAGTTAAEYDFTDGSGLSRVTLASPSAITKLLAYMYGSRHKDSWLSLLPVGGVDGTLRTRFAGHPEAAKIHAKTGSYMHVRALSGYAESPAYGPVAFSFIVNDSVAAPGEISHFLDTIGLKLIQ